MKQIISKLMIATCIMAGTGGLAYAVGPGPITITPTSIEFSAATGVSTKITPVIGLIAGNVEALQLLADISMETDDKSLQVFLIRFTPGTGINPIPGGARGPMVTLLGSGDATNKLMVFIDSDNGMVPAYPGAPGWFYIGDGVTRTATQTAKVVSAVAIPVNADTYPLSVDTAIYIH